MRRVYEFFYKGPASVVLSESEVKSLTTMLSDPPFASAATMKAAVSRNENFTKRCNTHTCERHRGQRPTPSTFSFRFTKVGTMNGIVDSGVEFCLRFRYGSDSFGEDERTNQRRFAWYIFIFKNFFI